MDKTYSVSVDLSGYVTVVASSEEAAREIVCNMSSQELFDACGDNWDIGGNITLEDDGDGWDNELSEEELKALISKGEKMERVFYYAEHDKYTWLYYNPDSVAGGQVVFINFDGDLVEEAEDLDDIQGLCYCELSDIGTDTFEESLIELVDAITDRICLGVSIYCSNETEEDLFKFLKEHNESTRKAREVKNG